MESDTDTDVDMSPPTTNVQFNQLITNLFISCQNELIGAKEVTKMFQGARKFLNLPALDKDEVMPEVQRVLVDVNKTLGQYDLGIRVCTDEITGKRTYGLLNITENPMFKYQTHYSKTEMELFYNFLKLIFTTGNSFSASLTQCINESRELKNGKMSLGDAEMFFKKQVGRSVLIEYGDENELTLGVRVVKELEPILLDLYPGSLVQCQLCKAFMLHGLKCRTCSTYVHTYCFKKYSDSSKHCISCTSNWTEEGGMLERKREENDVDEAESDVDETDGYVEADDVDEGNGDVDETNGDVDETNSDVDETDRDLDETDRDLDETSRDVDETDRDVHETGRDVNETGRDVHETGSDVDETDRDVDETERGADETDRDVDETERDVDGGNGNGNGGDSFSEMESDF